MQVHAVALQRVSKRYGCGPSAVAAVVDVTLEVACGEFVSVMGPSGCGKSTLLNLIAGLDRPDEGQVVVGGSDLAHLSDDARSDIRLHQIGFVFQSFNLFPTFTVEENVAWPLEFLGVRWREARERAAAALEQVGVAARAPGRPPGAGRQSCPAASNSGSRSRVRWSPIRRCCWPTNRPATSTPAPDRPSSICCARSTPSAT
jgi:ABC-type lipoprotein export system ATPase subunit